MNFYAELRPEPEPKLPPWPCEPRDELVSRQSLFTDVGDNLLKRLNWMTTCYSNLPRTFADEPLSSRSMQSSLNNPQRLVANPVCGCQLQGPSISSTMAMPAYLTVVWLVSRLIETLLLVDWPIVSAYADILINSSKKWRKESCINFCNAIAYRLLSDTWSLWPNFPKYKKKKNYNSQVQFRKLPSSV